jgi:hypothetical protein
MNYYFKRFVNELIETTYHSNENIISNKILKRGYDFFLMIFSIVLIF